MTKYLQPAERPLTVTGGYQRLRTRSHPGLIPTSRMELLTPGVRSSHHGPLSRQVSLRSTARLDSLVSRLSSTTHLNSLKSPSQRSLSQESREVGRLLSEGDIQTYGKDRAGSLSAGLLLAYRQRSGRRGTILNSDSTGLITQSGSLSLQAARRPSGLGLRMGMGMDPNDPLTPGVRDRPVTWGGALHSLKEQRRKEELQLKLKMVAKMAILCKRLAKSYVLRNKAYDEIAPYLNDLQFHDFDMDQSDLLFDPRQFKADRQLRLSEDAKRVLTKHTYDRGDEELRLTQVALRNNAAFSQYPVRMQRKITEVGRYEKFEAKRVIVRQGHRASAFYFILSGSVVVMVSDEISRVAKPVAYLQKGMTFGELAIINRTIRQASIVAKETVELLSIDIESFHKIFMAGGVKNINDPDHNQFIKSLDFLKGFPITILMDHPKKCIFHYFKAGEALVKDSHYSDWIYIVKSGSIKVLKKLKRVSPHLIPEHMRKLSQSKKSPQQIQEDLIQRDKQRRYILPDLHVPLAPPDDDLDNFSHDALQLPEIKIMKTDKKDRKSKTRSTPKDWSHDSDTGSDVIGSDDQNEAVQEIQVKKAKQNSGDRKRRMGVTVNPMLCDQQKTETGNKGTETHVKGFKYVQSRARQKSKERKEKHCRDSFEMEAEVEAEMKGRKQHIRTIAEDFDSKYTLKGPRELTEADLDPQFVHVLTLTKGQVFGIAEAVLGEQPSFCVVSSGAECIMIDKDFYVKHAPEDLLRRLRQSCSPYPSDEIMQAGLQTSVDWEAYKTRMFSDTLNYVKVKGQGDSMATPRWL